jgi:lipase ATG15
MNIESFFYLLLLSLCFLAVSLAFNFPSCYRNRKTFGTNLCEPKYQLYTDIIRDEKRNIKYKPKNPNLLSITRFICDSLLLVVSFGLVLIFYTFKDDESKKVFNDISPSEETQNIKNLLLPNICFSSIHNMALHLFLPFINDAYYYNHNSSFDSPNYKHLFYSDDYDITVLGNLINETESVKMIGYNVINKDKDIEVTILSIKGSSFNKDIYLDVQLFISTVLMTLLNTFSLITQKNLWSFKIMEYSLSIPYRIFFRHLIIDEYLNKLKDAYNDNEYQFFNDVVIVGHSLGGGLAKLFGRMVKKQAISLSGPGINAFHSLWNYKGESENFEISAIDLVPDRDFVPRVEVSGGTIYRIICKFGAFGCHSTVNSLCEVLIMCNSPNYNEYCNKVAGLSKDEIKEIADSVKLNN